MGEHVVHLAGESLAFGHAGRPGLDGPTLLQLDEQRLGLFVGLTQPHAQKQQSIATRQGAEDDEAGEALAGEADDDLQRDEGRDSQREGDPPREQTGEDEDAQKRSFGTGSGRLQAQAASPNWRR